MLKGIFCVLKTSAGIIIAIAVIIVVLIMLIRGCEVDRLRSEVSDLHGKLSESEHSIKLEKNEKMRFKLEKDKLECIYVELLKRKDKTIPYPIYLKDSVPVLCTTWVTKHIPEEGGAEISVDDSGKIEIEIRNKGFCLRPQASFGGSFGLHDITWKAGIAFRVWYWNRFGGYIGGYYTPDGYEFTPIGMNYRLDRLPLLSNSAIGIGYNPFTGKVGIEFGPFF